MPIGVKREKEIKHDFDKIMHMIIAGTTRYGKSIYFKIAITTLISKKPDNALFTLIDLKGGLTFSRYSKCPYIQGIASNAEEALEKLQAINVQMDHLKTGGYENVQEAGRKARHFVIIGEAAELAPGKGVNAN